MDLSMRLGLRQKHLLTVARLLKDSALLNYSIVCPAKSELSEQASAMELSKLPVNGTNPYSPFVTVNLLNLFNGFSPEYVHVFGGNAATALKNCMICRRLPSTLILTQPIDDASEAGMPKDSLLARGRFSGVEKIICPSVAAMKELRDKGVKEELTVSIPLNPDPVAVVRRPKGHGAHFVFLCRADATPLNGLGMLIKALTYLDGKQDVQPWELRVIGDYEDCTGLLRQAEELSVERHLCLLGRQDDAEQMAMADACVFPMTAPRHRNPFMLLAMGAGIPVVTSDISTSIEIVGAGNALVYEPDNPAMLASHMLRLMTDADLHRRLSEAVRAETPRHTLQEAAERVVGIYRDLIDRHAPTSLPRGD